MAKKKKRKSSSNLGMIMIAVILILGVAAFFVFQNSTEMTVLDTSQLCEIWLDDRSYDNVSFCSQVEAVIKANALGCTGSHTHLQEGVTLYMACEQHADLDPYVQTSGQSESALGY